MVCRRSENGIENRGKRVSVNLPGKLTTDDGVVVDVLVLDLSASGFRLISDEALLVGERVSLRVGREDSLPAIIRWVVGREAGGSFSEQAELRP